MALFFIRMNTKCIQMLRGVQFAAAIETPRTHPAVADWGSASPQLLFNSHPIITPARRFGVEPLSSATTSAPAASEQQAHEAAAYSRAHDKAAPGCRNQQASANVCGDDVHKQQPITAYGMTITPRCRSSALSRIFP